MTGKETGAVLLALNARVRRTGWAVFQGEELRDSGVISLPEGRRLCAATRLENLARCLNDLVVLWRPNRLACCQPAAIRWRNPSLELLQGVLVDWSQQHALRLFTYSSRQVGAAIAGRPNASRDQLGYSVMLRYHLIGQGKSTDELEAIAVGHCHLLRCTGDSG